MAHVVIFTRRDRGVLPGLELLEHRVTMLPCTAEAVAHAPDADVVVVDGAAELAAAKQLCRLLERDAAPLLAELAEIHGIGPKRLGRLYAAGLFTVDSVAGSDPQDIVAVTGIPEKLAVAVVESTHAYALEERQRCLSGLVEQAHRLRRILKAVPMDDVVTAAAAALREVERTLHSLEDVE